MDAITRFAAEQVCLFALPCQRVNSTFVQKVCKELCSHRVGASAAHPRGKKQLLQDGGREEVVINTLSFSEQF